MAGGGGYSLWDWFLGKPIVDAAGQVSSGAQVGDDGALWNWPRQSGTWGPRAQYQSYPQYYPDVESVTSQQQARGKREQQAKKATERQAAQEADKRQVQDNSNRSYDALHDPYQGQPTPTYNQRDPFTPLPGVPRTPNPDANPFGGADTGSSGSGVSGFGGGGPQQQMGVNPWMLLQMMMLHQNMQQNPTLGWFNTPFMAPPQMMGMGGGGGATSGGADSGGGGQSSPPGYVTPADTITKDQEARRVNTTYDNASKQYLQREGQQNANYDAAARQYEQDHVLVNGQWQPKPTSQYKQDYANASAEWEKTHDWDPGSKTWVPKRAEIRRSK